MERVRPQHGGPRGLLRVIPSQMILRVGLDFLPSLNDRTQGNYVTKGTGFMNELDGKIVIIMAPVIRSYR